jgi:hypothetical protein
LTFALTLLNQGSHVELNVKGGVEVEVHVHVHVNDDVQVNVNVNVNVERLRF